MLGRVGLFEPFPVGVAGFQEDDALGIDQGEHFAGFEDAVAAEHLLAGYIAQRRSRSTKVSALSVAPGVNLLSFVPILFILSMRRGTSATRLYGGGLIEDFVHIWRHALSHNSKAS